MIILLYMLSAVFLIMAMTYQIGKEPLKLLDCLACKQRPNALAPFLDREYEDLAEHDWDEILFYCVVDNNRTTMTIYLTQNQQSYCIKPDPEKIIFGPTGFVYCHNAPRRILLAGDERAFYMDSREFEEVARITWHRAKKVEFYTFDNRDTPLEQLLGREYVEQHYGPAKRPPRRKEPLVAKDIEDFEVELDSPRTMTGTEGLRYLLFAREYPDPD